MRIGNNSQPRGDARQRLEASQWRTRKQRLKAIGRERERERESKGLKPRGTRLKVLSQSLGGLSRHPRRLLSCRCVGETRRRCMPLLEGGSAYSQRLAGATYRDRRGSPRLYLSQSPTAPRAMSSSPRLAPGSPSAVVAICGSNRKALRNYNLIEAPVSRNPTPETSAWLFHKMRSHIKA